MCSVPLLQKGKWSQSLFRSLGFIVWMQSYSLPLQQMFIQMPKPLSPLKHRDISSYLSGYFYKLHVIYQVQCLDGILCAIYQAALGWHQNCPQNAVIHLTPLPENFF